MRCLGSIGVDDIGNDDNDNDNDNDGRFRRKGGYIYTYLKPEIYVISK
jgi:hypothetical protein